MQPGLYSVEFGTPLGMGYGVAVLDDQDNIQGGDAHYAYRGRLIRGQGVAAQQIAADLDVFRHKPGGTSVFGPTNQFRLQVNGVAPPAGGAISLSGGPMVGQQVPNVPINIVLDKI